MGTPIGNLRDITYRAVEVLNSVGSVFCEDTRVSLKLLKYYNIKKPLFSFNSHNFLKQSELVLNRLEHESVGLITDAGMPGISDPGSFLVDLVRKNNYEIIVIPGPSSLTASIALSGFKPNLWLFPGFFPKDNSKRKEIINAYVYSGGHLIFFESAKRLFDTLLWIRNNFKFNPRVCVFKEITKIYEEVICFELSLIEEKLESSNIKGEIVVALESAGTFVDKEEESYQLALELIKLGIEPSRVVRLLSKYLGVNKNCLYKKLLPN
ncbi:16S rRNA (cytidine(1402)-2'-O)-methyltransferase [Thermodesulfobium acidiphilum]|uniref:16S rRNA (cytidine(1402)-2'-O)-methyltransferase n=1 Tax=Thermodesulfobium acidiphilum TaxID=1794699 RepID=UPI002277CC58|nr:16S rRNA (cytidine(1402)-2'-O)-methyltransferase [Thermodesulfobium acidiphilum]